MASGSTTQRVKLPGSEHLVPTGARLVRKMSPGRWMEVTVGVRRASSLPDLSALDAVPPAQRQYMTREQFNADYGSDPAAVQAIEAFAQEYHLVVMQNAPASASLTLGGMVTDMSAAFGVTLFDFTQPELGDFHARTGPVYLPPGVADAMTGVFGLNNHRILTRKRGRTFPRTAQKVQTRGFAPGDLAMLYQFPDYQPASGTVPCIGILEFGGGVSDADVTAFFKAVHVLPPIVKVIAVNNVSTDPAADPDSTGEVMLDIDVAGALIPQGTLAVYFSTFDEKGLVDALSAVLQDSANDPAVLSISWGWAENQAFNNSGITWSAGAIAQCNNSFLAIAHLGITVCVATGDDGSEAEIQDGMAHVNFPASSPYVLAVGGTTLHSQSAAGGLTRVAEVVWNDGPGNGTGGGVSDITPMPIWQQGKVLVSINPGHFAGRAIPDVAADADPATGYLTVSGGQQEIVGGTSAAAPLWAGLITRINTQLGARVGNFNALLYSSIGPAGVLFDITTGNNDTGGLLDGQYQAGPGWDACTGWGTPDGQKLLAALRQPPAPP
jgi:kumamolisin